MDNEFAYFVREKDTKEILFGPYTKVNHATSAITVDIKSSANRYNLKPDQIFARSSNYEVVRMRYVEDGICEYKQPKR